MSASDDAIAINIYIGQRLRTRRKAMNIRQKALADALGISYQQLQKYENGKNRISAAKLWIIANQLGVPVSWFYPQARQ